MDAKRAAEGLVVITLGGILLANTIGGLPWAAWISILSLWPVALISAGIDLIGKGMGQTWIRVLSSLVMVAALLYGAFVMTPGTWGLPVIVRGGGAVSPVSETVRHEAGVSTGTARIAVGATDIEVIAGDELAALTGEATKGSQPSLQVDRNGDAASVVVDHRRQNGVWVIGAGSSSRLKLALDKRVRWSSIELDAGATRASFDLTDLEASAVRANIGAASATFTFGKGRDVDLQVNAGASDITVRVPKEAEVTLHVQGLPVATQVPAGFESSGNFADRTWTSFGKRDGHIGIVIEGGVVNVTLQSY